MTTQTTNQGLALPADADLNDIATHLAAYNAGVESRLVQRYLNSTDRFARNPSPPEGALSYLASDDRFDWFDGGTWLTIFSPGAWIPYTPSWGVVSGSPSAIGNGSLTGRFQQIGKTVHFVVTIIMGSTSTYSVTQWTLGLPTPARVTNELRPVFVGRVFDASPARNYFTVAHVRPGDPSTISLEVQSTVFGMDGMKQAFPINFAVDDLVMYSGTYEAL